MAPGFCSGSRSHLALRWAPWLSLLYVLGSCNGDGLTEIIVETDTDYAAGAELARVEWEIRYEGSDGTEMTVSPAPAIDLVPGDEARFPRTLTLLPPAGRPDARVTVTARGFGSDRALLAEQRRRTAFVVGQSVVLRLELSRICDLDACLPHSLLQPG